MIINYWEISSGHYLEICAGRFLIFLRLNGYIIAADVMSDYTGKYSVGNLKRDNDGIYSTGLLFFFASVIGLSCRV